MTRKSRVDKRLKEMSEDFEKLDKSFDGVKNMLDFQSSMIQKTNNWRTWAMRRIAELEIRLEDATDEVTDLRNKES